MLYVILLVKLLMPVCRLGRERNQYWFSKAHRRRICDLKSRRIAELIRGSSRARFSENRSRRERVHLGLLEAVAMQKSALFYRIFRGTRIKHSVENAAREVLRLPEEWEKERLDLPLLSSSFTDLYVENAQRALALADRCNRNRTDFLSKRILLPPCASGFLEHWLRTVVIPSGTTGPVGQSRTGGNVLRSIYACARSSESVSE